MTTATATNLIDQMVIAWSDEEPVLYAGPDPDRSGFSVLTFAFGETPKLHCDRDRVAPVDTPLADAKDPRIHVEKRTLREARDAGHYGRGSWLLTLPGYPRGMWHNTKAEAVAGGQRRLAIIDWHAANPLPPLSPEDADIRERFAEIRREVDRTVDLREYDRNSAGIKLNSDLKYIREQLSKREPEDPWLEALLAEYTAVRQDMFKRLLGMEVT